MNTRREKVDRLLITIKKAFEEKYKHLSEKDRPKFEITDFVNNASLWLDKYIEDATNDEEKRIKNDEDKPRVKLVNQVVRIKEPAIYKTYFEKTWQSHLHQFGAKCRKAKVKNRLAINLGSESVLETNISLHRIFGVPFIPGSSLKGMTAAFIRHYGEWKKDNKFYITVFGDQENAGFITFYDALYVPESGFNKKALYVDVMTTHHQGYYGEKKENNQMLPPADWDSPNPVPFISATGEYIIALSASEGCEDWINLTFDILGFALAHEGIGAKTSSGYGRLKLQDENGNYGNKYETSTSDQSSTSSSNENSDSPTQPISGSERIVHSFMQRINALRDNEIAGRIPCIAQECLAIDDEIAKKKVAKAIRQKVIDAKRDKASAEKQWFKQISLLTE